MDAGVERKVRGSKEIVQCPMHAPLSGRVLPGGRIWRGSQEGSKYVGIQCRCDSVRCGRVQIGRRPILGRRVAESDEAGSQGHFQEADVVQQVTELAAILRVRRVVIGKWIWTGSGDVERDARPGEVAHQRSRVFGDLPLIGRAHRTHGSSLSSLRVGCHVRSERVRITRTGPEHKRRPQGERRSGFLRGIGESNSTKLGCRGASARATPNCGGVEGWGL